MNETSEEIGGKVSMYGDKSDNNTDGNEVLIFQHTERQLAPATGDPLTLETISQAVYVLKLFDQGITANQLIEALAGERSLAHAYLLFFSQMDWIEGSSSKARLDMGLWRLTDKGRHTVYALTTDVV